MEDPLKTLLSKYLDSTNPKVVHISGSVGWMLWAVSCAVPPLCASLLALRALGQRCPQTGVTAVRTLSCRCKVTPRMRGREHARWRSTVSGRGSASARAYPRYLAYPSLVQRLARQWSETCLMPGHTLRVWG
jgi:hypothetical protein